MAETIHQGGGVVMLNDHDRERIRRALFFAREKWVSRIFRAKLKQIGQAPDVVTDQIPPVRRIGV